VKCKTCQLHRKTFLEINRLLHLAVNGVKTMSQSPLNNVCDGNWQKSWKLSAGVGVNVKVIKTIVIKREVTKMTEITATTRPTLLAKKALHRPRKPRLFKTQTEQKRQQNCCRQGIRNWDSSHKSRISQRDRLNGRSSGHQVIRSSGHHDRRDPSPHDRLFFGHFRGFLFSQHARGLLACRLASLPACRSPRINPPASRRPPANFDWLDYG
jgi:hypothetical protein